jgi:hypothetical protein
VDKDDVLSVLILLVHSKNNNIRRHDTSGKQHNSDCISDSTASISPQSSNSDVEEWGNPKLNPLILLTTDSGSGTEKVCLMFVLVNT